MARERRGGQGKVMWRGEDERRRGRREGEENAL